MGAVREEDALNPREPPVPPLPGPAEERRIHEGGHYIPSLFYRVERIEDMRPDPQVRGGVLYLVKWKGYQERTWESQANTRFCYH